MWFIFKLLWCFYQLFGLSFWRHPFTAEHPLVSKWCIAKFLQICEETNFWMANMVDTFLENIHFLCELFVKSTNLVLIFEWSVNPDKPTQLHARDFWKEASYLLQFCKRIQNLFWSSELLFVHTWSLRRGLLSHKSRSERARGLWDLRVRQKDVRPGSASHSCPLQNPEGERFLLSPLHLAISKSELRDCVLNSRLSCPYTKLFHTNQTVWT